jgi:hypothetical protein
VDASLVVGIIALALSLASLIWQAATYFLTGPRVRVRLHEGYGGPGGLMLGPTSMYTKDGLDALGRMGYSEHILAVEAINLGRLPATVNHWSIKFGNGVIYQNPNDELNPKLPYRLEPHSSATWQAPAEHFQSVQEDFTDQGEAAATVQGEIKLQGGRTVSSRNRLVVKSSGIRQVRRKWLPSRRWLPWTWLPSLGRRKGRKSLPEGSD